MTTVVDASVACKWFVEEEGTDRALVLFESDDALVAPDLIVAEVGNALWRKQRMGEITLELGSTSIERLAECFDELVPCAPLAVRSYELALSLSHPIYDCFYLALADDIDCGIATADGRLARLLASDRHWRHRLVLIGAENGG